MKVEVQATLTVEMPERLWRDSTAIAREVRQLIRSALRPASPQAVVACSLAVEVAEGEAMRIHARMTVTMEGAGHQEIGQVVVDTMLGALTAAGLRPSMENWASRDVEGMEERG